MSNLLSIGGFFFNIIVYVLLLVIWYRFFLLASVKSIRKYFYLRKNGLKTVGKVTDLKEYKDSDGIKTYKPVIEFMTIDNRVVIHIPEHSKMYPPASGAIVKILYEKDNTQIACIDSRRELIFQLILIVFALVILCLIIYTELHFIF